MLQRLSWSAALYHIIKRGNDSRCVGERPRCARPKAVSWRRCSTQPNGPAAATAQRSVGPIGESPSRFFPRAGHPRKFPGGDIQRGCCCRKERRLAQIPWPWRDSPVNADNAKPPFPREPCARQQRLVGPPASGPILHSPDQYRSTAHHGPNRSPFLPIRLCAFCGLGVKKS
jgi:hypothetical protein